jgi:hypothetical protein
MVAEALAGWLTSGDFMVECAFVRGGSYSPCRWLTTEDCHWGGHREGWVAFFTESEALMWAVVGWEGSLKAETCQMGGICAHYQSVSSQG